MLMKGAHQRERRSAANWLDFAWPAFFSQLECKIMYSRKYHINQQD